MADYRNRPSIDTPRPTIADLIRNANHAELAGLVGVILFGIADLYVLAVVFFPA